MKHVSQEKAVIPEDLWKRQPFKCQPTLCTGVRLFLAPVLNNRGYYWVTTGNP